MVENPLHKAKPFWKQTSKPPSRSSRAHNCLPRGCTSASRHLRAPELSPQRYCKASRPARKASPGRGQRAARGSDVTADPRRRACRQSELAALRPGIRGQGDIRTAQVACTLVLQAFAVQFQESIFFSSLGLHRNLP